MPKRCYTPTGSHTLSLVEIKPWPLCMKDNKACICVHAITNQAMIDFIFTCIHSWERPLMAMKSPGSILGAAVILQHEISIIIASALYGSWILVMLNSSFHRHQDALIQPLGLKRFRHHEEASHCEYKENYSTQNCIGARHKSKSQHCSQPGMYR